MWVNGKGAGGMPFVPQGKPAVREVEAKEPASRNSSGTQTAGGIPFVLQGKAAL